MPEVWLSHQVYNARSLIISSGAKTINVFRACLGGAQLTICAQKWRKFVLFSTVSLRFVLSRVCVFLYILGPRCTMPEVWLSHQVYNARSMIISSEVWLSHQVYNARSLIISSGVQCQKSDYLIRCTMPEVWLSHQVYNARSLIISSGIQCQKSDYLIWSGVQCSQESDDYLIRSLIISSGVQCQKSDYLIRCTMPGVWLSHQGPRL